jgi:hypothetical protein
VKHWYLVAGVILMMAGPSGGGELALRNGQRLPARLTGETLRISTGGDLVEVAPGDVRWLTREEVGLRDGRVLRGALVGERLRADTPYGELAVRIEDLVSFRADEPPPAPPESLSPAPAAQPAPGGGRAGSAPPQASAATPEPAGPGRGASPSGPRAVGEGAREVGRGVETAARGIGRTFVEGADRIHDGFKALGLAIWEAMKSVARQARDAF